MGVVNQTICDGCGKLLYGKKGIAIVKEDYIEIKGQITVHDVVKESGWVDHMYLTPTENEHLSFCKEFNGVKLDCLQSYIDARLVVVKGKIEASKRRRAQEEITGASEITHENTRGATGM